MTDFEVTTLGDVAAWGSGGTPKRDRKEFFDGDIPWAVIGDLNDGVVSHTASSISDLGLASSSAKWIEPGSVMVAMYGSIGKLGIAGRRMTSNQAIAQAKPNPDVDPGFLFWYLRSIRGQLQGLGRGGTQKNIGQGTLKSLPFLKPPLDYQRLVVSEIEKQVTRLEAASLSIKGSLSKTATYRRAVLAAAMTGRLTSRPQEPAPTEAEILQLRQTEQSRPAAMLAGALDVPAHWSVISLEQGTSPSRPICYGILKPRVAGEGTVPYVEVRDLRGGRVSEDLNRTSSELDEEFSRSRLRPGDVVLAIRGSYDRSAVVPESLAGANISRDVARVVPLPVLSPQFLSLYLQSPVAHRYFASIARGSAVKGLNIGDLRSMPIPVPALAEQTEIVTEVERLLSLTDNLAGQLTRDRYRGAVLLSSLLKAAFSGNLIKVES